MHVTTVYNRNAEPSANHRAAHRVKMGKPERKEPWEVILMVSPSGRRVHVERESYDACIRLGWTVPQMGTGGRVRGA